jgi:pyridoxamine 5'-phosphate oxidase
VDATRHAHSGQTETAGVPEAPGGAAAEASAAEASAAEASAAQASAAQAGGASLDEATVDGDPLAQFSRWMADAVAVPLPEPTAMVLATVSASGRPRARTVLLKSYDTGGFTFYTNRTSRKASDLAEVPRACLLFPWHPMYRQVIIEGPVTALSTEQSEPYFRSRPRGSQLAAWASRQSSVISSRGELEDRYAALAARWPEGSPVPMPDFWGGYRVVPEIFEFWSGRPDRMHDRLRYRQEDGRWLIERLAP